MAIIEDILEQMKADLLTLPALQTGGVEIGPEPSGNVRNTCAFLSVLGGVPDIHAVQLVDHQQEIVVTVVSHKASEIYGFGESLVYFWEDATRFGVLSGLGLLDINVADVAPIINRQSGHKLDVVYRINYREVV